MSTPSPATSRSDLRSQPTPPEPNTVVAVLMRIERRLRFNRWAAALTFVVAGLIVGVLAWRLLYIFGPAAPVLSALSMLIAVLALAGLVFLAARSLVRSRATLERAAAAADAHGGLHDELTSALFFLRAAGEERSGGAVGASGAWVNAHVAQAARTASTLHAKRVAPVHLPLLATASVAVLLLALGLVWAVPPLKPGIDADGQGAFGLTDEQRAQLSTLRELLQDQPEGGVTRKLKEALSRVERLDVTDSERQRALEQAQEAVEQGKLDAASAREGLYQLGQRLRGRKGTEALAQALSEGRADQAAELLDRMRAGSEGTSVRDMQADADAGLSEHTLDKLLAKAGTSGDADAQPLSSAAMKEAVDRLNQIAQQLEVQGQLNQGAPALQQMQLAVAQRSTLSAARFGQESSPVPQPSPLTGQTNMRGGVMFRSGAVAQEAKRSQQQEGSKAGEAIGESQADPLLGAAAQRLEAQLKREAVSGEGNDGEEKSEAWYYAESKQQNAQTGFRSVPARARFAEARSETPSGIAVQDRTIVKEYFMNLRGNTQ